MVKDAIATLKERTGSSLPAIKKYIEGKYGKDIHDKNFAKTLSQVLKTFVKSGKLVKIKGSFKLSEVGQSFKSYCCFQISL